MMTAKEPEPWLRGPVPGVDTRLAPLFYAFQQAREDLARFSEGLTPEQIWSRPHGIAPLGFHLRHMALSVERLMTYLQGRALTPEQLAAGDTEKQPGAGREELLAALESAFRDAEAVVRTIDPATFAEPRTVGRKRLPTTVLGLLTHTAEHTQRHLGEAIITAKIARVQP